MQIYLSVYELSRSITCTLQIADSVMTQLCKLGWFFFSLSTVLIKREQEEEEESVLPNQVELTLITNTETRQSVKLGKYKSSQYKNKL